MAIAIGLAHVACDRTSSKEDPAPEGDKRPAEADGATESAATPDAVGVAGAATKVLSKYEVRPLKGQRLVEVDTGSDLTGPVDVYVSMTDLVSNDKTLVALDDGKLDATAVKGHLISPLFDALAASADAQKEAADKTETEWPARVTIVADARLPFGTLVDVMYTSGRAEFRHFDLVVVDRDGRHRVVAVDPPRFTALGAAPRPMLSVFILEQSVQVRVAGETRAEGARNSAGELDFGAITPHARAFAKEHEGGVAVVSGEITITTQEIVQAMATLRGPDCRYPDPTGCIVTDVAVAAGAG